VACGTQKNNLPIVRKGITATTPYFLNYNGKREFLVDIAAFARFHSGSPIFVTREYVCG